MAPVMVLGGLLAALFLIIFRFSNAASYLSDDPRACINCHIMTPEYVTWERGSHGRVAVCNDCHVPHDNIFRKYFFKAQDGSRHAFMFTFRMEPQVIKAHKPSIGVIQENCLRCHANLVGQVRYANSTAEAAAHGDGRLCWECHRETPHGRVHSLASVPHARRPQQEPVIPDWLNPFSTQPKK